MEETVPRNDSINNTGDLSLSHHNLHFKSTQTHKSDRLVSPDSNVQKAAKQSATETHAHSQTHTKIAIIATTPAILLYPCRHF